MSDPVDQKFQAFNERSLDAFMEAYAEDARVEDGAGEVVFEESEQIRAFYGEVFRNSPELSCEVVDRISVGDWVIDEEQIEGLQAEGFPEEAHAAVPYRVEDGVITLVRMYT